MVRILFPPADSPSLTGSSAPGSRTPAFADLCCVFWSNHRDYMFDTKCETSGKIGTSGENPPAPCKPTPSSDGNPHWGE